VSVYDAVEGDRGDLDHYLAVADEVGARTVLDLGCGTGVLARRFAERGLTVTAVPNDSTPTSEIKPPAYPLLL